MIRYPYPNKRNVHFDDDLYREDTVKKGNLSNAKKYGNLLYHRIDLEVFKILKDFDQLVVHSDEEKDFISNYVCTGGAEHRIINIGKKEKKYHINDDDDCGDCEEE